MSFWKVYPNRKDKRKPSRHASHACRPHGGCPWCLANRMYSTIKRILSAESTKDETEETR